MVDIHDEARSADRTDTSTFEMQGSCPFGGDTVGGAFGDSPTLETWYPHRLRVELLHQNGLAADPMGPDFDYAAAFATHRPRRAQARHQDPADDVGAPGGPPTTATTARR